MKVLIVDFDLFQTVGGGQTFYRAVIEKNPTVDFYYFVISEDPDFKRPPNAHPISFREKYIGKKFEGYGPIASHWIGQFAEVSNIALSVRGRNFDVIDIPDYKQYGTLLRPAFRYYDVNFDRTVLSMHGVISKSMLLDWSTQDTDIRTLQEQEAIQYKAVDIRYGISKYYLNEWRKISDIQSHYLNPLAFLSLPEPTLAIPSEKLPSINFIGRMEKRKGPDIFINLVWWLPRSDYGNINMIGSFSGTNSKISLCNMIVNRNLDIAILPPMNHAGLTKLFSSKSVTILPSRYDQLNLIVLESLFSGCPTAISNRTGAWWFLREEFPSVPFITIDMSDIYSCIPMLNFVLKNYEEYRHRLVESLMDSKREASGPGVLEIYNSAPIYDDPARKDMDIFYYRLMSLYKKPAIQCQVAIREFVKSNISPNIRKKFSTYVSKFNRPSLKMLGRRILPQIFIREIKVLYQIIKVFLSGKNYLSSLNLPENTRQEQDNKLKQCAALLSKLYIGRVQIYRRMAHLEYLRGNDIVGAIYLLRGMRLLGHGYYHDLERVTDTLRTNNFIREAETVDAMYGSYTDEEKARRCTKLLTQAFEENRFFKKLEFEIMDDHRMFSKYRVSIIVSLYKAASKLPLFLRTLQNQTMVKTGTAEIILIDSGSPEDEHLAFRQIIKTLKMQVLYARSAKRETIQSAWNRGILLSKSPYITFLGVDEAIVPDCLEILTAELDADSTLDWVLGNSLVTNVDEDGTFVNDVMMYDRSGYRQGLVYLETCYLSWVGGLYRRSIHDRFGYYDSSFTAAGDTEFKNRVLPFIKTKAIPMTLGIFLNYPEERTTHHPRAEIEDIRAWYLHRTLAGIYRAFAGRNPEEVEDLFYTSLRYRKSYCQPWSTDIEYAYNLLVFLCEIKPDSTALEYFNGIKKLLKTYRMLDGIQNLSVHAMITAILRTYLIAAGVEQEHRIINKHIVKPHYKIFNDNRYEQHSNPWETEHL
jgi:glycosyltransferase involved in cell wall biosynthesis